MRNKNTMFIKNKTSILVVLFTLFFVFLNLETINAQCTTGCTVVGPTSGNVTVASGAIMCFTSNATLGDLTLGSGSTICVAQGVTVIVQTNLNSTAGTTVNWNIYGTLQFNGAPLLNANLNATIYSGGIFRVGTSGTNDFKFNGSGNNYIYNYGTMALGVLDFNNSSGKYYFDNYGTLTINSNINITGNTTRLKNQAGGTINIGASYNMNSGTIFVNCGTFNTKNFNMNGGKLINTASFNVNKGNVNYGSTSAKVENYGSFTVVNGAIQFNGPGSVFYNEGVTSLSGTGGTFQNDGSITGPPAGLGKIGYISFQKKATMNNGSIGPNLNFKNTGGTSSFAAMFNATITQTAPLYWDCEAAGTCVAPKQTSLGLCPDINGNFPPDAKNDNFTITVGGTGTVSVLANDFFVSGTQATLSNVNLTQVSTTNAGVTLNVSTGMISVAANVTPGTYIVQYQICDKAYPSNCDIANATIQVLADFDGDGIPDKYDLDDDNDGILDEIEDNITCFNSTVTTLNTPNYATNTALNTSTTQSPVNLNGLAGGLINFSATLTGTRITWTSPAIDLGGGNMAGGVRIKNYYSGLKEYIHLTSKASGNNGTIYATYIFNFTKPVTNVSFLSGELDGSDTHEIYAYNGTNVVPVSSVNIDVSTNTVPGGNGWIVTDIVNGVKVRGEGFPSPSSFTTTLNVPITKIVVRAYQGNNFPNEDVATYIGALKFCTAPLDSDGDGIINSLDLDSDNDGCTDAIEGDENVLPSHLNSSGAIVTNASGTVNGNNKATVDANGVPVLVNSGGAADVGGDVGQGVGTSQNALSNPCNNLWVGTNSTDYNTTTNWKASALPIPGTNVEFATAANNSGNAAVRDMYIPAGTTITLGNLTNASTKATVIQPNTGLIIQGKITGSETDANKLQVQAATGTTPNGTLLMSCTNQGSTKVMGTVQMYAKGIKGPLWQWTDTIPGSPTNGTLYQGYYRWQHFGVPVKSIVANPTFYGSYLREYSEPKNATSSYYYKWTDLGNNSILTMFKGYEITQDAAKIITMQGELVLCDQQITLTRSAAAVTGSTDPKINNSRYGLGQNIFGNSFTASIPIDKMVFPVGVEQTVYLYNTGSFGQWTGQVVSQTATLAGSYIAIPKNVATTLSYGKIPSMNGFLLRHMGLTSNVPDTPITMTLPYTELTKNVMPQTVKRQQKSAVHALSYLEMYLNSESTSDKVVLFSQPGTSVRFDNGWDGLKFFGTPTAFIYVPTPDGNMQIHTAENIVGTYINFVANAETDYVLTLKQHNLTDYANLQLVDLSTNKVIPLDKDSISYPFTASKAGGITKRFVLRGKSFSNNGNHNGIVDGLNVYAAGKSIYVTNQTDYEGLMRVYDMSGRTLLITNVPTMSINEEVKSTLTPGAYIIKLTANGEEKNVKILIK